MIFLKNSSTIKINIGCGLDIKENYINYDLTPLHPSVLKLDLENMMIPHEDNSVDKIIAQDVLEHIFDLSKVMKEFYRVLKPGGKVYIRVPHFTYHCAYEDPTHCRRFSSESFKYFCSSHRRAYEVDAKFNKCYIFLAFLKRWYLPYNYFVEKFVNISFATNYIYEVSFLRNLFPAENINCILTK